jgi:spoIIIJ-associated protein
LVIQSQDQNPEVNPSPRQAGIEEITRFCERLVDGLQMEIGVAASESEGIVSVNLTGPDRSQLLSNTAALLNSVEHLLNKAFRTGKEAKISFIVVDSDRYRQHREAELTLLAEMAAKKVVTQGRPLSLQPMTPRERRIVHLALAGIEGVRSQSDGEGDNRSITIYPS